MTLDSDWTLAFDPGDNKVEGTVPQVGLVFRGPLAEPARIVDVAAVRLVPQHPPGRAHPGDPGRGGSEPPEKERFNRSKRKLREDADRREREAREAAEAAARAEEERHAAAAAALGKLEAFHLDREILIETRAAAELTASRDATDRAVAAKAAAEAAAKAAADTATAGACRRR